MPLAAAAAALRALGAYYVTLTYCLVTRCNVEAAPLLQSDPAALAHVYSLARTLLMWRAPHYRAPSLADDLRANLRNVAIPGTGIPLSWFCANRWLAVFFLYVVNPLACAAGAAYLTATGQPAAAPAAAGGFSSAAAATNSTSGGGGAAAFAGTFRELLLAPRHWLATWRLNCLLVAWHAAASGGAREYALEDKAPFLLEAERLGLPGAPFVKAARVFVKHRGVEGGQGIHVYDNFTAGGDWIISEALSNAPCLARMLPRDAPLSTFRVVTASVVWLEEREARRSAAAAAASAGADEASPHPGAPHAAPAGDGPASPGGAAGATRRAPSQQLSPLLHHDRPPPPPWARSPSPGAPWPPPLSPSPGIRSLLAGRRSRGCGVASPPLPVSSAAQHPGVTPRPGGGTCGGDGGACGAGGGGGGGSEGWHSPAGRSAAGSSSSGAVYERSIEVLTGVFRAGLAGAKTDHVSICYPIDESGELGPGVTATHWYRTGWRAALNIPRESRAVYEEHPQSGRLVAGQVIPDYWPSVAALALQAHALMAPGVPLIGWDVALPSEGEPCLLEMNISCNLFNGGYDREGYADLVCAFFAELGRAEEEQRAERARAARRAR